MKNTIFGMIRNFIRQAARDRLVRRVSSVLACLVVFVTAYMLILPAITLSGHYPYLEAEEHSAVAGETLTMRVRAEAPEGDRDRIVTLVMDSGNAGLSERYVFDEDGTTVITGTGGQEILLHRSARTDRADVVDYWFELPAGENAEFDLELQDMISVEEIVEEARRAGILTPENTVEDPAKESGDTATASDAAAVRATQSDAASSSDAEKSASRKKSALLKKTASLKTASSSDAAKSAGEDTDEDGVLADGEILNDLEIEPEETAAEITASLLVRAGSGETLQAAVRDAEKSAEKRGDAASEFRWKAEISYELIRSIFRKSILAGDGKTYQVTVTYGIDAGIPEGSELNVSEIVKTADSRNAAAGRAASGSRTPSDATPSDAVYDDYVSRAERVLGFEEGSASHVRLFDIRIVDRKDEKVTIQAPVSVEIVLTDETGEKTASPEAQVVHFADDSEIPDVIRDVEIAEAEGEGESVALTFDAPGFSVYAIVDAPEPAGVHEAASLAEITAHGDEGFFVDLKGSDNMYYYLNGEVVDNVTGNPDRKGLVTTEGAATDEIPSGAVRFYFELAEGTEDQFRVYTIKDGQQQYVKMTTVSGNQNRAGLNLVPDEEEATVFTLEKKASGGRTTFYVSAKLNNKNFYWNRNTNTSYPGYGAIAGYSDKADKNVALIRLQYGSPAGDDPYGLDGKSFGSAYHNDSAVSVALMAETKDEKHLAGLDMVMQPDVLDHDGVLLVAADSDISMWTFEWVEEDKYRIRSDAGEYLTLNGQKLTLSSEPDETYSVFRAVPGTGANSGKYTFSVSNYSIELDKNAANGFWGTNSSNATKWLNLVEKSVLSEDDFRLYTAKKVSVSDEEQVPDGAQVIVYTRVWNETKKKYEFFAVDSNGSLIPCYDTGDGIEWVGTNVNTALWDFKEGHNADGSLSYYYYLKNHQYGQYIVPQLSKDQILYTSTVTDGSEDFKASVNLNGRRYGRNFTTVIAWDEDQYAYSGMKAENGRVVPCALSEADDFYFAIMIEKPEPQAVTEVPTVDNDDYGITMRMFDFNNDLKNNRDSEQLAFMGADNKTGPGLLTTDLKEDNYPQITSKAGEEGVGKSFAKLIEKAEPSIDVNHLFIQSIYNESGYFEYNSTQNFAHLNEDTGNFTVYDQIGAITGSGETGPTRTHGQFMPYNTISAEKGYAVSTGGKVITNQTDVLAKELPDLNARKGENLYLIGNNNEGGGDKYRDKHGKGVDYFFGMEMEAGFTQTASGLDAWGHDIIFEFSGDDDFWLYVDGELVIDLGGVHSAQVGSVNFRTGLITSSTGNSTLYDTFRNNYIARGVPEAEIETRLAEIFAQNEAGQYVFKDYTEHTMRMFYMERGAGASNLYMRFNLAAVKPGTFLLSKTLTGTDGLSNNLVEFPYQIWYESELDSEWHLLGAKTGETDLVLYEGTTTPVKYMAEYTPAGGSTPYKHVFFLKHKETAEVTLPDKALRYKVVECGINPNVYDEVKINGVVSAGTESANTAGTTSRRDHATTEATLKERSRVDYENHVREGALRTLSVTKRLFDENGSTPLHYDTLPGEKEDKTVFAFRLYLGVEGTEAENLPPANLYPYLIKNRDKQYCRREGKRFVPIVYEGAVITEYNVLVRYLATLSEAAKESVVFRTSPSGSISQIPADYTVEVRDVVVGTMWKAEERDDEIPRGYTLRLEDGYTRVDKVPEERHGITPIDGTMEEDEDPRVEVRNQKGWGLTVNKVWTDKDFMEFHDTIYFAVYVKESETEYRLLPETVRPMTNTEKSLYYFFGNLQSGIPFDQYEVFEVTCELDQDGKPIISTVKRIPGGGTLTIGGTPAGGTYVKDGFEYMVSYEKGEPTIHNENVRTDTVTNSRPGIKIFKRQWDFETPLAGAEFTLKDSEGKPVAAQSYFSDADGLVTIAYLNPGTEEADAEYELKEITTPRGFARAEYPQTIKVDKDGKVDVDTRPPEGYLQYYRFTPAKDATETEPTEMAVIDVRNRSAALGVIKVDPDEGTAGSPVSGVHFALYRQVEDGQGRKIKDYTPMAGYEDLVTDENGIPAAGEGEDRKLISMDNPDLTWGGTYYLTETQAVSGYDILGEDLCFTIGTDGIVTVNSEGHKNWLTSYTDSDTGKLTWIITIPNRKLKKFSFMKVDIAEPVDSRLDGAEFDLYRVIDGKRESTPYLSGLVSGGVSGQPGMLAKDGKIVFELPKGTYHLIETKTPDGYHMRASAIVITVTGETDTVDKEFVPGHVHGVTYDEGTILSSSGSGEKYVAETEVYTLKISNSAGHVLPSTGGGGTRIFTLTGLLLMAASLLMYLKLRGRAA